MSLRTSVIIIVAALYSATASAAYIPYFKMDSLAIQSEAVVLAAELDLGQQTTRTNEWGHPYQCREARFRVIETLKGSLTNGQDITVLIGTIYTRRYETDAGSTNAPSAIPPGHALLFLERRATDFHPVLGGIKLVIGNQTYCYGQFVGNPGPLWLALQHPENLDLPDTEPYTEAMLLKDVRLALNQAKTLIKPEMSSAEQAKRKTAPNQVPEDTARKLADPQH